MTKATYRCPVCSYRTLHSRGEFEICPVCFWEDEGDIENIDVPTYGPNNGLSLADAKKHFQQFGAVDESLVSKVRKPNTEEL